MLGGKIEKMHFNHPLIKFPLNRGQKSDWPVVHCDATHDAHDDDDDDYVGDDDDRSDDDGDGYVCGGSKKRGQRPAAAGVSPKCNWLNRHFVDAMRMTRTMSVIKMMILPLPKWKPTKMGMTDALEGCRKFSSRTKARGLSRAATAGGSSRFTGGQIPRMRIPNFEVTGQKKMGEDGGWWSKVAPRWGKIEAEI